MSTHEDPAAQSPPSADPTPPGITRKSLLRAAVATGFAVPLIGTAAAAVAMADDRSAKFTTVPGPAGAPLAVTPACHDGDAPTIDQTEGPYFEPGSPQTTVLTGPGGGTPLTVSGVVYGLACQPIANALLDFWQADNGGNYDMSGYNFRGHQYTDSQGRFSLTTIVPGLYPGRTKHIHVKVQAPNQPILTTQLYFPGVPQNSTDTIYDPRLLMTVTQHGSGVAGAFDFVLNVQQDPGPPPTSSPPSSPPPTSPPPGGGTWQPDHTYAAGDVVTYGGATYTCLQGHTSMVGWEPPNVPALWQRQ
ncbi:carbohydrate-binding protein [Catenulispora subtropica]|uniref:Dioxygenase n=1 Tax=Catenulispora subtropica TaxID=450798 RepID=A0ABN2RHN2_9ACTN